MGDGAVLLGRVLAHAERITDIAAGLQRAAEAFVWDAQFGIDSPRTAALAAAVAGRHRADALRAAALAARVSWQQADAASG